MSVGRCRTFLLSLLALVSAWAGPPSPTHADGKRVFYDDDAKKPLMPVRLDGHASLTWEGYLGVGARVDIPVLQKGLGYSTRDELAVSLGTDVIFLTLDGGSQPLQVWPTATVQWSLGLSDQFSFFPELGLVGEVDRNGWKGVFPNIGFGGRYYLWRSVSLLGRVGWPMAISLGATF